MATSSEVKAALDDIATSIRTERQALKNAKARITTGNNNLGAIPTVFATAVLPWCGPVIGFRAAAINNSLIDGAGDITSILALLDDARGEPAQGALPVNPDMVTKVDWLYKFLRNKITNDGTNIEVYNDAEAVVDHKAPVSEAAGTVTRGEFITGP